MIEKVKTKRVEERVGGDRHKVGRIQEFSQSQKEIRKLKRKLKNMKRRNLNKKKYFLKKKKLNLFLCKEL